MAIEQERRTSTFIGTLRADDSVVEYAGPRWAVALDDARIAGVAGDRLGVPQLVEADVQGRPARSLLERATRQPAQGFGLLGALAKLALLSLP